ncbi:MAG TPA: DNA topoisomerase, partial [Actinobacteria bacterium]|nr:DNA topoisomerase [Actinomycetes bacterium]HEX21717.1 DNA topoisomerase [Actinomycetota bacterium]
NHKTEKFWDKKEVDKAVANICDEAVAVNVKKTEKNLSPPAPFNTTSFLAAAANQGLSPANAMRIAEGLYMKGFISYPRVDNTVYPKSINFRDILTALEGTDKLGALAKKINAQTKLEPTRGKRMATDHPPIHPTAAVRKDAVSERDWKIYELIVRRFLANLAPKAKIASVRIDFDANNEPLYIRGSQTKSPGWLEFYPYGKRKDNPVPDICKGDKVKIIEKIVEAKETQPPARYSQSSLIQKMEELNLGTKATRHNIIKNLYDRGYTHNDPVIPTDLGIAVADTLNKYANKISSPEMTAELEAEMNNIAQGNSKQEEVVDRSRQILAKTLVELSTKKEEVGQQIRAGILESQTLGKCPNSEGNLRIIRSKKTRKRFVGCSDYPDCKTTYPLPQYGEIIPLGEICPECGSPKIKVINKGKRPWTICIDPNCITKDEYKKSKKNTK